MTKKVFYFLSIFTFLFLLIGCQSTAPEDAHEAVAEIEENASPMDLFTPTPDIQLNAELQELEGSVEAKTDSNVEFSIAQNGTLLSELGEVRTLEDGYARVNLSSGSLVRMAPLSHFTLVSNEPKDESLLTQLKLEAGQLWVVLNGGSVEIETPSGVAAVRGSYMMVEVDPETREAFISCLEGQCSLENAAGIIQLVNGQRARLKLPEAGVDFELPEIEKMDERDFAKWLSLVPEAQEIFPLLEKEGVLPWKNWKDFVPDMNGFNPSLEKLLSEENRPINRDCPPGMDCPLDGTPPAGDCPPGMDCPVLDGDVTPPHPPTSLPTLPPPSPPTPLPTPLPTLPSLP